MPSTPQDNTRPDSFDEIIFGLIEHIKSIKKNLFSEGYFAFFQADGHLVGYRNLDEIDRMAVQNGRRLDLNIKTGNYFYIRMLNPVSYAGGRRATNMTSCSKTYTRNLSLRLVYVMNKANRFQLEMFTMSAFSGLKDFSLASFNLEPYVTLAEELEYHPLKKGDALSPLRDITLAHADFNFSNSFSVTDNCEYTICEVC